ncbi:DUF5668 domain-containing protein [Ravibacter arvi]|uniref:DUF5668 domain-containing protein n=1 Tax=Ravibacter arvi TaxID=2051041 RepID=A0ABP8M6V6_9BACT
MRDFEPGGGPAFDGERKKFSNNKITGGILLVVGVAILLRNVFPDFPRWVFRWEMILVTIGLIVGIRQQFRGAGWFVLVAIGTISLLDEIIPAFNRPQFTWATIAIACGIYLILKPGLRLRALREANPPADGIPPSRDRDFFGKGTGYVRTDVIDATSIFGSVKKVVVTKNFRGGEVVTIMGGTEIDLSKADITGTVRLDATNIMGGTELVVPATWDVQSDVVAVLGGVEDKRDPHFLRTEPGKLLILEGVCLLGGIEIKSY